jgi:hypothetical protein
VRHTKYSSTFLDQIVFMGGLFALDTLVGRLKFYA